MTLKLDFFERLNQYVNTLDLYARSSIGDLHQSDAIAMMPLPGGSETVFFDGVRDKYVNVQFNAKSKNQQNCLNALTQIYQKLENLSDLESGNGSFEFQHINTTSMPSLYQLDEQQHFYYEVSVQAKITIYQGVEI